ncbi:ZinT family metal-binding protein [Falsigemmobacter faecalis]|uniref:Metal-binding protein ZinT n=1 Tax=Falsigemmobacter faecalis TaxID=2488730 RepID=A0A3P3DQ76_9RHOB|nr:metal-binding protein ZinT [Falsigemmobacter faecalis]RRH76365.1 metal-binding protein ZinT [Falsigemmobacter faecalis]
MHRISLVALFCFSAALAFGPPLWAQKTPHSHSHSHAHDHRHDHAHDEEAGKIAHGYFSDAQVAPRPLSDWAGVWQSVFPLLQDGTLDPVMAQKAAGGTRTAAEWGAYYEAGYRTDIAAITITAEGAFTFRRADGSGFAGQYASDGQEVLTYAKGNRGVRFSFRKTGGDAGAPLYVQFSDHRISPSVSDHFHLYWGNDRAALLEEVSHWPTYYPAALSGAEIAAGMMAH